MALVKNVGKTERIVRVCVGVAGIFLFLPLTGAAQWVSLAAGAFFLATGVHRH